MLTQTYHHHIQNIPHKNTFYLFMEAYMEFENADFGCEKHDKCKIQQTVPFKRKSLQGLKETASVVEKQEHARAFGGLSRLIKRPSLEVQTPPSY